MDQSFNCVLIIYVLSVTTLFSKACEAQASRGSDLHPTVLRTEEVPVHSSTQWMCTEEKYYLVTNSHRVRTRIQMALPLC